MLGRKIISFRAIGTSVYIFDSLQIHFQFENLFTQKPSMFNKFWDTHRSPHIVLEVSSQYHYP